MCKNYKLNGLNFKNEFFTVFYGLELFLNPFIFERQNASGRLSFLISKFSKKKIEDSTSLTYSLYIVQLSSMRQFSFLSSIVPLLLLGLSNRTQSVENPPYSNDNGLLLDSRSELNQNADDSHYHWHVERSRLNSQLTQIWEKHESFDKEELQALIAHAKEGRPYTPRQRHDVVFTD
jgi:hypothetical protein